MCLTRVIEVAATRPADVPNIQVIAGEFSLKELRHSTPYVSNIVRISVGLSSRRLSTTRLARDSLSRVVVPVSAIHFMPARHAASTPCIECSMTQQELGLTPSKAAANSNTSGSGLPCSTSAPVTATVNLAPQQSLSSDNTMLAIEPDDRLPIILIR